MLQRYLKPTAALQSVCPGGRHLAPHSRIPPQRHLVEHRSSTSAVSVAPSAKKAVAAGTDRNPPLQRLEAVLLLAREPITSRKLAQLAHLEDGTQARTLVRALNRLYDDSGRAFRVEELASGYQMLTRKKFATWLRRLNHVPGEVRLSAPALETLAVVAYRQPVAKAQIEAIRGVHCAEILRQLMERDLVRLGGRSEELGRPYLYATTKRFLQQFGLRSLEELPRAEILRSATVPPVGKDTKSGHHTSRSNEVSNVSLVAESSDSNAIHSRSIVAKESDVSVTLSPELFSRERATRSIGPAGLPTRFVPDVRLDDDDDDFEDEDEDDDDDDDDEEEGDDEFEEELDDDEDEEEEELEDDDLAEDEEWEEVEDEDDEEDDDDFDDDDDDWDDEDDEDADDEEEEDDDE